MTRGKHHFGPWATTLHYGSRLELSAFWRRRIGRLESLASKRPRLNWAGTVALAIVAGALVGVPRLRVEKTAHAQEPAAASASSAGTAGTTSQAVRQIEEPFTATFSNGVKVQLVGLSENPSREKAWWMPDGSPLATAPYATVNATMRADKDRLARELCWRWINRPDDPDFESNWQVLPSPSGSGGGIPNDNKGNPVEGVTAMAIMPKAQDTCNVRFSVSVRATPWKTVFINRGRNLMATGGTIDGLQQGAIFAEPYADNRGTSITVSYQIPGKAVRLLAFGADGLPDVGQSKGGAGSMGFSQATYHFAGLPPDKILRFELQTQQRQFETIEFRNVSLHAGKRTTIQVVDSGQMRYEQSLAALAVLANEHRYVLTGNEPLKHLPQPFPLPRQEIADILGSYSAHGTAAESPPVKFIRYQWKDNELFAQSFDHVKPTLRVVLDSVFDLKLQELEGDLDLLDLEVPGDWVLSWDPRESHKTNANEIAVLERVLRDQVGQNISLEFRDVLRPVLVARGSYRFTPVAGPDGKVHRVDADVAARSDGMFQIPGRRTDITYSAGSYREFLHAMGQLLLTPVIDEADEKPSKESMFWHYHGKQAGGLLEPFDGQTTAAILDSITKQTGLKFEKRLRKVPTLLIRRDATNN